MTSNRNYIKSEIDEDIDELALIAVNNEPKTYKEAINSADNTTWFNSMKREIDDLYAQNTWSLVYLPPNRKALKGRWVYKIKTDHNNNIITYKARWVVKGYSQVLGLDYKETFSNTSRPKLYRLLFSLIAYYNWEIK